MEKKFLKKIKKVTLMKKKLNSAFILLNKLFQKYGKKLIFSRKKKIKRKRKKKRIIMRIIIQYMKKTKKFRH